ncbi:MAG TPA: mechanosensitive ion channel [Candidatus Absconditabacterales bacterium]|nr:mechanosensitive ion channel [Candidatus Absconditabacterales bacterium]HMT26844.1 mechanosensitive ion channel [Candidatus Absconditabacterales bacterium]
MNNSLANNQIIESSRQILENPVINFMITLLSAAISVFIGYIIINYITQKVKQRIGENSLEDNDEYQTKIANLIGTIIFNILMVFNVLLGFQILGFKVGVLMGGVAFGIGFAMQQILGNMIAGIMLITNSKFKIGDIIEVKSLKVFGKIQEIKIRYSIIKTFDRRRVIIPNLQFMNESIRTFNSEKIIRGYIDFYVGFKDNLEKAKQIIKDEINKHEYTIEKEYTKVAISEFRESGITLRAFFYFNPKGGKSGYIIKSELRKSIPEILYDYKEINYPYNHTSISVDHNDQDILESINILGKNI